MHRCLSYNLYFRTRKREDRKDRSYNKALNRLEHSHVKYCCNMKGQILALLNHFTFFSGAEQLLCSSTFLELEQTDMRSGFSAVPLTQTQATAELWLLLGVVRRRPSLTV